MINNAGGPEQIRTDGRAVAVPCLTTWLQGHPYSDLYYSKPPFYCQINFIFLLFFGTLILTLPIFDV